VQLHACEPETDGQDLALQAVRRCWGGMLTLGATTFWETFSPEWQRVLQPHDAIPNGATGFTSAWGGGGGGGGLGGGM
jgi:hypothetical protein